MTEQTSPNPKGRDAFGGKLEKGVSIRAIVDALSVENVREAYSGLVEISDLKEHFGTDGHILVVRGDKAYADKEDYDPEVANPKFWLYEKLIQSPEVQEALQKHPEYKLFDGGGFSSLAALRHHAKKLGHKAVFVMSAGIVIPEDVRADENIEIIQAEEHGEWGYVAAQAKILSERKDVIPLHQALYGARALAPIGNRVVEMLKESGVEPNSTYWTIASGASVIGIGGKIKEAFPEVETVVVEPDINKTVDPSLKLSDPVAVKAFAKDQLRHYSLKNWDKKHSGIYPLHIARQNRYMLVKSAATGKVAFDKVVNVSMTEVESTRKQLSQISPEFDWTKTTALALVPAIQAAKKGQNVVVMSYGRFMQHESTDGIILDGGGREVG